MTVHLHSALREVLTTVRAAGSALSTLVLVEGDSDRAALQAVAEVLGRDLGAEGVLVGSMGGITNLGHFLDALQVDLAAAAARIAVLCDAAEEDDVAHLLDRHGVDGEIAVCRQDLEDELIRALRPDQVEAVVAAQGDLRAFRSLQGQPE